MAEAPEIPEAKDPFERNVALSIAVLAVVLSVISMVGDGAKLSATLAATGAANNWAYFQSKSIKETSYKLQRETVAILGPGTVDEAKRQELLKSYDAAVVKYEREKNEISAKAEEFEAEVKRQGAVDERTDLASLQIEVAIVLASVSILVAWSRLWHVSLLLGLTGALTGVSALFL